ncbi:MAG: phosphonoacetate hydrolase [Planctomycetota bacterium]|nr:phosphonoacetate hydrolase [Planctomycetota bacterium]
MNDSPQIASGPFRLNGRDYQLPACPVVAVCIDGCADEYLSSAIAHGHMPRLQQMAASGFRGMARGAMPSFTNVNNAAIACGGPPSLTGISGNFFLDPDSGEEVMMNSPEYLRAPTVFAAASHAGRKVAVVTAKDKLRKFLSKDLEAGICFSSEKANETSMEENGIEDAEALVGRSTPEVYSGDLSLFAMEAGAALLERGEADFLYLTLSDYVQHKHTPDEPEALEFYAGIDAVIGRCLDAGARVGVTADHGMNGKTTAGKPNVLFVEDELRAAFGAGVRVICTITDPYVVHHGALGGFVVVHLEDPSLAEAICRHCLTLPGVAEALPREAAAAKLELPADRLGDLVVLSTRNWVLGRSAEHHDLAMLGGVLRSHGSRYEEIVPLILSEPMPQSQLENAWSDLRSFDLFPLLCPVSS